MAISLLRTMRMQCLNTHFNPSQNLPPIRNGYSFFATKLSSALFGLQITKAAFLCPPAIPNRDSKKFIKLDPRLHADFMKRCQDIAKDRFPNPIIPTLGSYKKPERLHELLNLDIDKPLFGKLKKDKNTNSVFAHKKLFDTDMSHGLPVKTNQYHHYESTAKGRGWDLAEPILTTHKQRKNELIKEVKHSPNQPKWFTPMPEGQKIAKRSIPE